MAKRYVTYKTATGWITYEADITGPIVPDDENGPFEITKAESDQVKAAAVIELTEDQTDVIIIPNEGA